MKRRILLCLVIGTMLIQCMGFSACGKKLTKYSMYSFDYFDTVTTISGYAKDEEEFDRKNSESITGFLQSITGLMVWKTFVP